VVINPDPSPKVQGKESSCRRRISRRRTCSPTCRDCSPEKGRGGNGWQQQKRRSPRAGREGCPDFEPLGGTGPAPRRHRRRTEGRVEAGPRRLVLDRRRETLIRVWKALVSHRQRRLKAKLKRTGSDERCNLMSVPEKLPRGVRDLHEIRRLAGGRAAPHGPNSSRNRPYRAGRPESKKAGEHRRGRDAASSGRPGAAMELRGRRRIARGAEPTKKPGPETMRAPQRRTRSAGIARP